MRNAILIMVLSALVLAGFSGCGIVPQKQYELQEELVAEDGTVYPAGTKVWKDAEGNPTFADTGDPWLEDDVEKVQALAESAEKGANQLPWFGGLIGLIVGVAGSAAVSGLMKKRESDRAKTDEKLKGKPKA